jgi:hypothetical protein
MNSTPSSTLIGAGCAVGVVVAAPLEPRVRRVDSGGEGSGWLPSCRDNCMEADVARPRYRQCSTQSLLTTAAPRAMLDKNLSSSSGSSRFKQGQERQGQVQCVNSNE